MALTAGTFGTMLGLGGGIVLVPTLTLVFGVPLESSVAASAIAVVANSLSGSGVYVRAHFTNVRLALLLLVPTAAGALAGGLLVVSIPESITKTLFAALLFYIAYVMAHQHAPHPELDATLKDVQDRYDLAGRYRDPAMRRDVGYVPHALRIGIPVSSIAGISSGMFGIGGGPITVPLLTLVMGVPLKAAAGTSSFMIGLTASASSLIYYTHGVVNTRVTIAAIFGIIIGARLGARTSSYIHPDKLLRVFVVILVLMAVLMGMDGAGLL